MSECNKHKADCENVTIKIQKNLEIIKKNDEKIKKLENGLMKMKLLKQNTLLLYAFAIA